MKRSEHRAKEQILTQADPARVRKSADSIVLKGGAMFLVTDEAGDIPFARPHAGGLFFHDCRFLDGYRLTVNGATPIVLGGNAVRSVAFGGHETGEMARRGGATAYLEKPFRMGDLMAELVRTGRRRPHSPSGRS